MTARLLLVEDDTFLSRLIARRLQSRSYEVLLAGDGFEAVAVARRQLPDVILMDLNLPKLDGYQAMQQIRADAATKHIPIIAVTAQTYDPRHAHILQVCAAYLVKPVQFNQLVRTINSLINPAVTLS